MSEQFVKNDPNEMKLARDYSWLCEIFQINNLSYEDKKEILKMIKEDKTIG